jgi:hypothetical protein
MYDFPNRVIIGSIMPPPLDPMPFLVGAPRSGTTLLRFMLDAHPALAIPPETGFLAGAAELVSDACDARERLFRLVTTSPPAAPSWPDFGLDSNEFRQRLGAIEPFDIAEGFRAFYRMYAERQGKPRYGDKTPGYCEHIGVIERILPESRFVHIIRDGRDTALSLRPLWFAPGRDMKTLALFWRQRVESGRAAGARARAYLEVRYENLVRDPRSVLEPVCAFLELDFDPAMLRYWERTPERLKEHRTRYLLDGSVAVTHEQRLEQQRLTMQPPIPARIARWKVEMTAAEQAEFLESAGDTLQALGYLT